MLWKGLTEMASCLCSSTRRRKWHADSLLPARVTLVWLRLGREKGDIACVLLGCSIPVCLRKREADASYEFIGEFYVHGFMDGEIIEELESGRRKIEHFRLW